MMASNRSNNAETKALLSDDGNASVSNSVPLRPISANHETEELQWRVVQKIGYRDSTCRRVTHWLLAICTCFISLFVAYFADEWYCNRRYARVPLSQADLVRVQLASSDPARAQKKKKSKTASTNKHDSSSHVIDSERGDHHTTTAAAAAADDDIYMEWEMVHVEEMDTITCNERPYTCCSLCPYTPSSAATIEADKRMIVIRYQRYRWDGPTADYVPLRPLDGANGRYYYNELRPSLAQGLSSNDARALVVAHGHNELNVVVPGILVLLRDEVLHPFFIFQIYSVIVWMTEAYYTFAVAIFIIAIISIAESLYELRRNLTEVSKLARQSCDVTVLRDGTLHHISSAYIAPGDIIDLTLMKTAVPCDIILLSGGTIIIDESMLTGESVPVVKTPLALPVETAAMRDHKDDVFVAFDGQVAHTLFGATKIVAVKPYGTDQRVLGMVIRTGFGTSKGALILSIMYPSPASFKFLQQSWRFLGMLCCVTLIGFIISVYQIAQQGGSTYDYVVNLTDLITIIVPPSLPYAIGVGTNLAISALRMKNVFTISPARVNMAGKVRFMAFDKTGTLTEDRLEVQGVRSVVNQSSTGVSFDTYHLRIAQVNDELTAAMNCCHELTMVDGVAIGDPLDHIIFTFTNGHFADRPNERAFDMKWTPAAVDGNEAAAAAPVERHIIVRQRFEFQSALQDMAVIADDTNAGDHVIYVKGAPEVIAAKCVASSLPSDWTTILGSYTNKGLRVIAYASRHVTTVPLQGDMTKSEYRAMVSQQLQFLGFVVLCNPIKPETAPTLKLLRDAQVRFIMVTGDHLRTAVAVARDPACGLVDSNCGVFISQLTYTSGGPVLTWVNDEDEKLTLDGNTLRIVGTPPSWMHHYELALSGDVYQYLSAMPRGQSPDSMFNRCLLAAQIFARMRPAQKASLMTYLQNLGIYIGMCGDGANDCGALKAAHIGVSLSSLEASVSAPFTCSQPNISCVPDVLREGRSSLATAYILFRFLVMYAMIQFWSATILTLYDTEWGNYEYLYQDLFVVFPLTVFLGKTTSGDKLTSRRPSVGLFSFYNASSIIAHIAVAVAWQYLIVSLARSQTDYYTYVNDKFMGPWTMEATALEYFVSFQYIAMTIVFAWGRPWKRLFFTNWKLTLWLAIVITTSLLMLIIPMPQHYPVGMTAVNGSHLRSAIVHLASLLGIDLTSPLHSGTRIAAVLSWSDRLSNTFGWFWTDFVYLSEPFRMRILEFVPIMIASHLALEYVIWPSGAWLYRRCRPHAQLFSAAFGRASFKDGAPRLFHRLRCEFEAGWPVSPSVPDGAL